MDGRSTRDEWDAFFNELAAMPGVTTEVPGSRYRGMYRKQVTRYILPDNRCIERGPFGFVTLRCALTRERGLYPRNWDMKDYARNVARAKYWLENIPYWSDEAYDKWFRPGPRRPAGFPETRARGSSACRSC